MNRDELELLRALRVVSDQVVPFVLDFLAGELDADRELHFAHQLAGIAERIRRHGEDRQRRIVVDGEVTDRAGDPSPPGLPRGR